jgi:hypothetical protein
MSAVILNAVAHLADWRFMTLMLVSGLLWTLGPREAFRPAVAVPVMLRAATAVAALVVAGLLGASCWLVLVVLAAGVGAVSLVSSLLAR